MSLFLILDKFWSVIDFDPNKNDGYRSNRLDFKHVSVLSDYIVSTAFLFEAYRLYLINEYIASHFHYMRLKMAGHNKLL